jgi:hypothetical protein
MMKKSLLFLSLILLYCTACKKDILPTEIWEVEADEITEEAFLEQPDIYDPEGNPKVISVTGIQATAESGLGDCNPVTNPFKYKDYFAAPQNPYPGNKLIFTLSLPDTIDAVSCDYNSDINVDSFRTISTTQVEVTIKAMHDSLTNKTVKIGLRSKSKRNTNGTNVITSKSVKVIGLINTKFYGSPHWLVRSFRKKNGTFLNPLASLLDIDNDYKPRKGDILYWSANYLGTVATEPILTNKPAKGTEAAYIEYKFSLLEANAKCKNSKTTKVVKMKSNNVLETLLSADKNNRGAPESYYRDL